MTEPTKEVWVVWNPDGASFVSSYRQGAMEHALLMAGEFPENGPWRVTRYVVAPDNAVLTGAGNENK